MIDDLPSTVETIARNLNLNCDVEIVNKVADRWSLNNTQKTVKTTFKIKK